MSENLKTTGNTTTLEKFQRLHTIKGFLEEGKKAKDIAEETGLSLTVVRKNINYLEQLNVADLTSKEVAEKRSELYIELLEAATKAKELFNKHKDSEKVVNANYAFNSWMKTIELRAKLYGLDAIKSEGVVINQQFNQKGAVAIEDKISSDAGERLAKIIKREHESKVQSKYEESQLDE